MIRSPAADVVDADDFRLASVSDYRVPPLPPPDHDAITLRAAQTLGEHRPGKPWAPQQDLPLRPARCRLAS